MSPREPLNTDLTRRMHPYRLEAPERSRIQILIFFDTHVQLSSGGAERHGVGDPFSTFAFLGNWTLLRPMKTHFSVVEELGRSTAVIKFEHCPDVDVTMGVIKQVQNCSTDVQYSNSRSCGNIHANIFKHKQNNPTHM